MGRLNVPKLILAIAASDDHSLLPAGTPPLPPDEQTIAQQEAFPCHHRVEEGNHANFAKKEIHTVYGLP